LDSDENWLDAAILSCPRCGARLFCAVHSPMCDDHRLYCQRCPRAVEIGYYDPVYDRAIQGLPDGYTWEQSMARVEPLLRPCTCGGRFSATDRRHCIACGGPIPEASGKDVSPYIGHEDSDRDPTPVEEAEFDRFEKEFVRRHDIWLEPIEDA
jgi:ribosomal protein S27AE